MHLSIQGQIKIQESIDKLVQWTSKIYMDGKQLGSTTSENDLYY